MVIAETLVKCSICGAPTEWDESLDPPLCVACWDGRADVDNKVAAYKHAYYEAHKDEVAAYKHAYYEAHKEIPQEFFVKEEKVHADRQNSTEPH